MIKAGDKLHYEFLSVIAYEGFEKYFSKDKANIKHFWGNYILYRKRRYLKTASMMLKSILRYYYENDSERFYKIFNSEIGIATKLNGKLTSANHHEIDLEYNKIVNSESKNFLIKTSQSRDETPHTNSRISRFARLFSTSIKQDGVYLTGEKIVRKVNAKLTKKKR